MEINGVTEDSSGSVASAKRSRKRHIIIFVAATIINGGLLVLLGFALLTPAAKQPSSNSSGATVLGDVSSPLIGKPAPDFALSALNAGSATVHLADFKGKVVVLNFWQSSCDPCNTEAPFMQKAWTQAQSKGVVFIGIDVPDTSDAARAFLRKYGITYLNVEDTLNATTAISYDVSAFPETYFIDKNGVAVAKWIAPLSAEGLQFELAKLHMKLAIK